MRSTVPWRVAGPLAAVLILAGGLQAQPAGGGRCGQGRQSGFFPGRPGGQGRQNLMTALQQQNGSTNPSAFPNALLQNGSTNPNALLNALQRRQNYLQSALQRTNNRLNVLQQSGSTSQTALVNALQQRQTVLQNALRQVIALQTALQQQTGQLTPSQPQPLLQQQVALPLGGMQVPGSR
jgi:hypothetical protein